MSRPVLWAGVILGLGLTGCGSRRVDTPRLSHVRVAYRPKSSVAPLYVAADGGFMAKENIQVDFVPIDEGGPSALAALVQGEIDVNMFSPRADFLNAVARGSKARIVAGMGRIENGKCVQVAWVVRSDWLDKDGHLDPQRLRGARMRLDPLSHAAYQTDRALATVGLSISDLRRSPVSSGNVEQALERRDLDFAYLAAIPLVKAMKSPRIAIWKTLPDVLPNTQLVNLAFAPRLLGPDREIGVRFLTGYLRGLRAFNRGLTPEFKDILSKHFQLSRPEIESCCWPTFPDDAPIDFEHWVDYERWAAAQNALDRSLPIAAFADRGLLAEALRRLADRPQ